MILKISIAWKSFIKLVLSESPHVTWSNHFERKPYHIGYTWKAFPQYELLCELREYYYVKRPYCTGLIEKVSHHYVFSFYQRKSCYNGCIWLFFFLSVCFIWFWSILCSEKHLSHCLHLYVFSQCVSLYDIFVSKIFM